MRNESLVKISVKGNKIDRLDLTTSNWSKLEYLDLSENGLIKIISLENLNNLKTFDLGKLYISYLTLLADVPR